MSEEILKTEKEEKVLVPTFDIETLSKKMKDGELVYQEREKLVKLIGDDLSKIDLSNVDAETKEGKYLLNLVYSKKQQLVKIRTSSDKEGMDLRRPINDFSKSIKDIYDGFILKVEKVEAHPIILKMNEIEEEIKQKKIHFELAKNKIVDDRIEALENAGLVLNINTQYYENSIGISCTRLHLETMEDAVFDNMLTKSQAAKTEKEKNDKIESDRLEKVQSRLNKLVRMGLRLLGSYYVLFNEVTGANEQVLLKEVETGGDEDFKNSVLHFVGIKNGNVEYRSKQEANRLEQERLEKILKDDRLELQKNQVTVWQNLFKELGQGYSYAYGTEMEDSEFIFSNPQGKVATKVGSIFKDNTLVQVFISQAQQLIAKQKVEIDKVEAKRINDEKEKRISKFKGIGGLENESEIRFDHIGFIAQKDTIAEPSEIDFEKIYSVIKKSVQDYDLKIAADKAKQKEAEDKDKAVNDLIIIDETLESLDGKLILFKMNEFNVMEEKVNKFINVINNNIENFKEQIKHLR